MEKGILNELSELLSEELCTRAAIQNYKVKSFKALIRIVKNAEKNNEIEKLRGICLEHLKHTQNSIIANYVMGKLNYEEGVLEDGHILELINIFVDNKKFNIVEFLARDVLKYGENRDALKALALFLEKENRGKELVSIWKRLVKIDFSEAQLTSKRAKIMEEEGNYGEAVNYYKKALIRYLKKGKFYQIEEIWKKLIELAPGDLNFYLNIEKRIAKAMGDERSSFLLYLIFPYYKKKGEFDIVINLLKKIFSYDSENKKVQEELIECYRKKYKTHS